MSSEGPEIAWRHERKFLVRDVDRRSLERVVLAHPAHFRRRYAARQVNNLYLDTSGHRSYYETVEGVPRRTKHRLRWYGELQGDVERPVLECKAKRGLLGTKRSAPVPGFRLASGAPLPDVRALLRRADLPDALRVALDSLEPALVNCYVRQYFESADAALRITLDRELEFFATRRRGLAHRWCDRGTSVLELKYLPEADDAARRAAQALPFRATRSSKYARGIEGLTRGVASS